jgi:hypothetical protein
MKYVKIIGLMAVAAMALTAMFAASASANSKTCSTAASTHTPTTACGAGHGNVYQGAFDATLEAGTQAVLTATNPDNTTVKCTESTVQGTIANGTTGTGTITKLSFGGCSSGFCSLLGGKVTAEGTTYPWASTATTTTAGVNNGNGTLDVTNAAGKFVCSAGPTVCEYTAATASVDITGSDTAPTAKATNVALTKTVGPEFTCGTTGDWSGAYIVTTPSSFWVE